MKEQEQRIAIAEAHLGKPEKTQNAECLYWMIRGHWIKVPEYLHDLDAIQAAAQMLDESERADYADCLSSILGLDGWAIWNEQDAFRFAFATAPQRAEAFLRTLGKWTE